MKKFLLFLLPVIAFALGGCNKDEDLLNPDLIKGSWEVVANDHFEYTTVYTFETIKDFNNYGILEVKYLHTDGSVVEEIPVRKYEWHASGPKNNNGILDISLTPYDLDVDDPDFFWEIYEITNLTPSKMTWKGIDGYPSTTIGKAIEFIRR